jgi:DNA-binding protein YbaB
MGEMIHMKKAIFLILLASWLVIAATAPAQDPVFDYRVLATNKTSTMEKEMNEAAEAGFVFAAVMGGETSFGGNEVVVIMTKDPAQPAAPRRIYKLLATKKTSTMQKEMQGLGNEGFEYRGQTVFNSTFGGREVSVIMECDTARSSRKIEYKLLATSRTSTMQKELQEAGKEGFRLVGMTVGETSFGGRELVSILRRETR